MSWKEFLKPEWRKIVIVVIFFIFSLSYKRVNNKLILQPVSIGFPLPIFVYALGIYTIIYSGLLVNLIFWYLLSCLIVWIYDKYLRKVKKKSE